MNLTLIICGQQSSKTCQCGPQISLRRAWPRIRRWPSFGLTWWWGCLPFLRLRTTTPTSIAATIAIPANPKVTYTELLSLFNSTWRTEKLWKKQKNCKYMDRLAFFHCLNGHIIMFSILIDFEGASLCVKSNWRRGNAALCLWSWSLQGLLWGPP